MATLNQGLGVKAGGSGGGGGGTDTNLGNTDLSADAARIYDVNGNDLTFENGTTNILQLDESDNSVKIGGASPYIMPTARGTINEVLGLTDSTGTAAWRTATDTIKVVQQTPATNNFLNTAALTVNNVYVSQTEIGRKGTWASLGSVTSTTISTVINQPITLADPFRSFSSVNISMAGTMMIKFYSTVAGNYDFYVVRLTQLTGTAIATTPVTFYSLGSVSIGRELNAWQCLEFSTDEVIAAPCSSYYFAILPRQSQEESWNCVAHWTQDSDITRVYS
jgi:hypothetical protein